MDIDEYVEIAPRDQELSSETLKSRRTMLEDIDNWCRDNLDKPLEDVTPKEATRYVDERLSERWYGDADPQVIRDEQGKFKEMRGGSISTDTARHYVDALRGYMKLNLGIIEREESDFDRWFKSMYEQIPSSDYERKRNQNQPAFFTKSEIQDIIEAASMKYKLIYKLMFDSGRRPSEIAMLKVDRIDFDDNKIEYDILKKNNNVTADVKVNEGAMNLLERYVKHRVDEDDEYVFSTDSKQGHLTTSSMGKALKRHAEKAGVGLDNRSLKSFRHSHVTHRVASGESLSRIRRTGTHNTERVMEGSYEGLADKEMDDATTGLDVLNDNDDSDDEPKDDHTPASRVSNPKADDEIQKQADEVVERFNL